MNLAPIMDGFVTTDGRFISRWEAAHLARNAGQAETGGIFGATRGLASENLKNPQVAQAARAASSRADLRTGATAPGLPGGQGVWAEMDQPREGAARTALFHRADRSAAMDVRGRADYEIQASLQNAWDTGHDAVIVYNYIRPGGTSLENVIVVRDANQLRSPDAAFDPAKRSSQDIMASLAAILGGGAVAGATSQRADAAERE